MSDQLATRLYEEIAAANEPRAYENWHASSIAQCPRAQLFARLAVPPVNVPTAAKMLRWQAGHTFEATIRPYLEKLYPDLKSNVRLTSEKMDLTGEYDNYSEKEKLLIEVKTVGPRAPRYRKKEDTRFHLREDRPYLSHEYQNHGYVLLLREAGLEVERITYVYITLEGLLITYETVVDESEGGILAGVKNRLEVLQKAQGGNPHAVLPECVCKPDNPLWGSCLQFCDYKMDTGCCSVSLLSKEQLNKFKE